MKKIYFVLLVALNFLFVFKLEAQMTLYFMDRLPQSQQYNPALIPKINFFLEFPITGHEQFEVNNSGFNLGQLLDFSDNLGLTNYNPDKFVNSIGDYNTTTLESRTNIFSFGFSMKKIGYLSVGLSERNFLDLKAPSNMVYLLTDYEKSIDKMPIIINDISLRMNMFSQLSVTYARTFGEKLTIGISPKLIGALGAIYSEQLNMQVQETAPGEFDQKFNGKVRVGLPVPINPMAILPNGELDTNEDIISSDWNRNLSAGSLFQNPGLAFDFGINYLLNNRWSVSASLLDVGKSSWKKNSYSLTYNGDEAKVENLNKMKMKIPSRIFLAGNYKLTRKWNTGLLFSTVFYDSGNYSSATLSLNGFVGSMLSTSFSYTASRSFDNLGFGLRLRFLPGNDLFVVTDNILQAFNYRKIQYSSISFGINLAFGLQNKNTDETL